MFFCPAQKNNIYYYIHINQYYIKYICCIILFENTIDEDAVAYDNKKVKCLLTRTEKLSLKKYWLIKKFKLKPDDLNLEFLLNWYGKEYILDNVAFALGKKKLNDINDPYLNNMRQKLDYLDIILKVYGFKHIFDFDNVVVKDKAMEQRMINSKLLDAEVYDNLMKCFGKRQQGKIKKFAVNKYIMITELILNDYGIGLKSKRCRQRLNNERINIIKYNLIEIRRGITNLYNVPD